MSRLYCLCLLLLVVPLSGSARTIVNGNVAGLWTPDGNPYIVDTLAVVLSGAELILQPGVEVWMGEYVGQWGATHLDSLIVHGRLILQGTPDSTVLLHRRPGCDYAGVLFFDGDTLDARKCEFEGVTYLANSHARFISCTFPQHSSNSSILLQRDHFDPFSPIAVFDSCLFEDNGIHVEQTAIRVTNSRFTRGYLTFAQATRATVDACSTADGPFDIYFSDNSQGTVSHSRVSSFDLDSEGPIRIERCLINGNGISVMSGAPEIFNNTITSSVGLALRDDRHRINFRNNILYGCTIGISCRPYDSLAHLSIDYNLIWADSPIEGLEPTLGHNLIADPLLIGGDPFDYGLRWGSPAINAGDPNLPRDPDNTRSDIGAYPFVQQGNMPPVVSAPESVFGGVGDTIEIMATATDDWPGIRWQIANNPDWLQPVGALSGDTLRLRGIPPHDAVAHTTVTVTAVDMDRARTSKDVKIDLFRTVLNDPTLHGHLIRDESPYCLSINERWNYEIPLNDTLFLDPGAELTASLVDQGDFWAAAIRSSGVLVLQGTEEEPIHLNFGGRIIFSEGVRPNAIFATNARINNCSFQSQDGQCKISLNNVITQNLELRSGGDTVFASNCTFISSDIFGTGPAARILDCEFRNSGFSIWNDTANVLVQNCVLHNSHIGGSSIQNCDFYDSGVGVNGIMRDCEFSGGSFGSYGSSALLSNLHCQNTEVSCTDTTSLTVQHCSFAGGAAPINLSCLSGTVDVNDCIFDGIQLSDALHPNVLIVQADTCTISGCTFENNQTPVWAVFDPAPYVVGLFPTLQDGPPWNPIGVRASFDHNLCVNNRGNFFIGGFDSVYALNNTFVGNEGRLDLRQQVVAYCRDNIFASSLVQGLVFDTHHAPNENYNLFWNNTGWDIAGFDGTRIGFGPHDMSINPLLLGIDPFAYRLSRNSPAIDTGSPNDPADPDGSPCDVGYRPYDHNNQPPLVHHQGGDTLRAHPGEVVLFSLLAEDPDHDSLYYRWFLDGHPAGGRGALQCAPTLEVTTPDTGSVQVLGVAMDGNDLDSTSWVLEMSTDGVGSDPSLPREFALHAPYPNPFNDRALVTFDLPRETDLKLALYDVRGRRVAELVSGEMTAGVHRIAIDAGRWRATLTSGTYFLRMESTAFTGTQRVVMVK